LLDALEIDADTELELSTDGDVLVVTPVRSRKRKKRAAELVARSARAVRRGVPPTRRVSEPEFLTLDEVLGIHADRIRVYEGASGLIRSWMGTSGRL